MEVHAIKAKSPHEFFELYESLIKEDIWIAYFTGSIDQETGHNWCPDCSKVEPAVEEALTEVKPIGKLVKIFVKTKEEWVGNPKHPYKVHEKLNVKGVPTMILFSKDEELARLEGDALGNKKAVHALITNNL